MPSDTITKPAQIRQPNGLMDNGGAVQNINSPQKRRYNAYVQGVSDATCGAIIILPKTAETPPTRKYALDAIGHNRTWDQRRHRKIIQGDHTALNRLLGKRELRH